MPEREKGGGILKALRGRRGCPGPKGPGLSTAPALRPARETLQPRPFFLCLSVLSLFLLCRPRASCRAQAGLGQLGGLWQSGGPVPVPAAGLSPSPQGLARLSAGPGAPLSWAAAPAQAARPNTNMAAGSPCPSTTAPSMPRDAPPASGPCWGTGPWAQGPG